MVYTVKTYEFFEWNSDHDKAPNYILVGSFASGDEAIKACQDMVAKQMKKLRKEGKSFDEAVSAFRIYGEIPVIFGDPPVNFDCNSYIATLDERTKKLDKILYKIIEELTYGEDITISHSTQIVSSTDKTIKAHWKAALLYRIDGQQSLQGLPIPDGVALEERTILLTWATKKDCTELSDGFNYEWTDENQDTETWIDWDSVDITHQMFEIAKERILDSGGADLLVEWFGSVEQIEFSLYPRLFQPFLRALVDANKAKDDDMYALIDQEIPTLPSLIDFDMSSPNVYVDNSHSVRIMFPSKREAESLWFHLNFDQIGWIGEVSIIKMSRGSSYFPKPIAIQPFRVSATLTIDDLVKEISELSIRDLFASDMDKLSEK